MAAAVGAQLPTPRRGGILRTHAIGRRPGYPAPRARKSAVITLCRLSMDGAPQAARVAW